MRSLLLLAAVLAFSGCAAHPPRAAPKPPPRDTGRGFAFVHVEDAVYIIDPYSQSCFLRLYHWAGGGAMHAVPCDKLKQNLLEAARHITWISAPKRTSDEARPTPSPQAPQVPAPQAPQAPTPPPAQAPSQVPQAPTPPPAPTP